LTVVLRKSEKVPLIATAGLDTVGIRMPQFAAAHAFLDACGVPVVAPSANLSGRPSPTTWEAVLEDLGGRIDCILQGDATEIGLESTVVDCTGDVPVLLRSGAVSLADLQAVAPGTVMFSADIGVLARSPGLRHRHYSPRATVRIVHERETMDEIAADREATAFIGLSQGGEPTSEWLLTRICSTTEEYAHSIFEFFRECDRVGVRTIYCEAVEETGIGAALMDRLRRAEAG
jgi:L-threonylcarbamoyladenylate synthase